MKKRMGKHSGQWKKGRKRGRALNPRSQAINVLIEQQGMLNLRRQKIMQGSQAARKAGDHKKAGALEEEYGALGEEMKRIEELIIQVNKNRKR